MIPARLARLENQHRYKRRGHLHCLLTGWLFTGTWWVMWIKARSQPPGLPILLLTRLIIYTSRIFLCLLSRLNQLLSSLRILHPASDSVNETLTHILCVFINMHCVNFCSCKELAFHHLFFSEPLSLWQEGVLRIGRDAWEQRHVDNGSWVL